jgi:hypothetical protein
MHVLLWVAAFLLLSAAAALGVFAWRTARGVRERESAQVELLKALAFGDASAVPASGPSISDWTAGEFLSEQETAPEVSADAPAAAIFSERAKPKTSMPRWIPLAVLGAVVVAVRLYVALALGPPPARATMPTDLATATPQPVATVTDETIAVADKPIELIALQYKFGRAEAFDVSGLVRNPADGRALSGLMAVINLLDADGHILTSQKTPLKRPVLEAGQTSAFSLVFKRVSGSIANYQVEFRLKSGETISQVDLRSSSSEPAPKASSY